MGAMGYLTYYLAFIALRYLLGYGLHYPVLIGAAVILYLGRRWLPDPYLFFKHAARVRALKADIAQNADNVTARRDLAKIWLEKRRPRRAIPLLVEARRREQDSAELAFLHGKALLMAGRAEESLAPLVEAATRNDKLLYGESYLQAGRALWRLGRAAEAEDAFERYVAINSSSVEGRVRLACARREQRDRDGADRAMREAVDTFAQIPGFRRRAELLWYLRVKLMRVGLA
jgi:tetratricopeptide (TPR) repeat protein